MAGYRFVWLDADLYGWIYICMAGHTFVWLDRVKRGEKCEFSMWQRSMQFEGETRNCMFHMRPQSRSIKYQVKGPLVISPDTSLQDDTFARLILFEMRSEEEKRRNFAKSGERMSRA